MTNWRGSQFGCSQSLPDVFDLLCYPSLIDEPGDQRDGTEAEVLGNARMRSMHQMSTTFDITPSPIGDMALHVYLLLALVPEFCLPEAGAPASPKWQQQQQNLCPSVLAKIVSGLPLQLQNIARQSMDVNGGLLAWNYRGINTYQGCSHHLGLLGYTWGFSTAQVNTTTEYHCHLICSIMWTMPK